MSIFAYVGLPGSGKSYSVVVNQVMAALNKGRAVVTNVPLNRDAIRSRVRTGEIIDFPIETIAEFPERVDDYAIPGCVLILDEVWRLWPAGQKVDRVPEPFKSLLAEHRHRVDRHGNSMQVVLVTQDLSQIGAFARQLVEQTIYHTKLTTVGMSGKFRADIYQGAISGTNPPAGRRVREVFGRYKKENFELYKSHTMAVDDSKLDAINETSIDTRGNYLKRPVMIIGLIAVLAIPALAAPYLADIVSGEKSLAGGASLSGSSPDDLPPPRTNPPSQLARPVGVQKVARAVEKTPDYFIDGYIIGQRSIALIRDGKRVVRINWKNCELVYSDQAECAYRGWRVGTAGALEKLENNL